MLVTKKSLSIAMDRLIISELSYRNTNKIELINKKKTLRSWGYVAFCPLPSLCQN